MQDELKKWLSDASLENSEELISSRVGVVLDVAKSIDRPIAELLLRLTFGATKGFNQSEINGFRSLFDGDFGSPGDEELRLLAAVCLWQNMKSQAKGAVNSALMILTADLGGARRLNQPMDLKALATATLGHMSGESRTRPELPAIKSATFQVDISKAFTKLTAADPALVNSALNSLSQAFNSSLTAMVRRQQLAEKAFHRILRVQDEELDMLWWLQGGLCESAEKEFSEVESCIRPVALASDLAAMTFEAPGPAAVSALLVRAGAGSEVLKVAETISRPSPKLLSNFLSDYSDRTSSLTHL